jgi:murein DD-endopeptidase MepM/ murein hydrolase activator NlpD
MRVLLPTTAAAIAVVAALLAPAPASAAGPEIGGYGDDYFLNDGWSGTANRVYDYGLPGDGAVVGDWNGDRVDTIGVRRGSFYLLADRHGVEAPAHSFIYGRPADVTLVGDWNGDGRDTLAVRRGNTYYFNDELTGGDASAVIRYGRADDQVLVGDWDGDGRDTLGVRRGNVFYLRNVLAGGEADIRVPYGKAEDVVYVGDWNGDRIDTLAVRREARYYVKDDFTGGEADRVLTYGRPGDATLVGDWNGDGADTLGVRRGSRPAANVVSWADGTYGAFGATTTIGSGNRTIALPSSARRGLVTIASADTRLTVDVVAADGTAQRVVAGVAGARTALWGDPAGGDARSIRISSTGAWVVTLHPVSSLEALESAGDGSELALYGGAGGVLTATHSADGSLQVLQYVSRRPAAGSLAPLYPDERRTVVTGVRAASGSGTLAAGPSIVDVGVGTWRLALPAPPPAPSSLPQPTSVPKSSVVFPLAGEYRLSRTITETHNGADLLQPAWSPIHAVADGVVSFTGWSGGYGNLVTVRHVVDGKPVETRSAHMINTPPVLAGQRVVAGQIIGYMGSTGNSTANHLHIEVRVDGQIVDPMQWLPVEG